MAQQIPIEPAGGGTASEIRDVARKRVLMQATIISVAGPQRVFIKDLTSCGARIECDQRLQEDWDVIFKRDDLFVAARVAWVGKDGAGLQFYRALHARAHVSGS